MKHFIGIEEFSSNLVNLMALFGSDIFSAPKGIIFYGPPGTGKSAITTVLCKKSGMTFVT